jgi:hypothetical protein
VVTVVDSAAPDFGKISWHISRIKAKVAELSCSVSERVAHHAKSIRKEQRFQGVNTYYFVFLKRFRWPFSKRL